jgi:hypothetical protein
MPKANKSHYYTIFDKKSDTEYVLELMMHDNRWLFVDLFETELTLMAKFYSPTTKCFLNLRQTEMLVLEREQKLQVKPIYEKI